MPIPSLQNFETFLCVAENNGFTAAAKKLNISKAAVSNSIKLLEESLKIPLFIRNTRNISLTEEGELLLTQCYRLKHELDTARDLVSKFHDSPTGTLKISCNPYFANNFLIKKLQTYMQKYPKVNIEILVEERMPDLENEQIDIIFGINWPAPLDTTRKIIGKTRYVLCASKPYLEKFGTPKNLKDLEINHNYIPHLGRKNKNNLVNLKENLNPNLNLNSNLKSNNAKFMKKFALENMGIIQLHDYMIEEEIKNGSLIEILKDNFKQEIPIYIYYQRHRFVQPKVRNFVNLF